MSIANILNKTSTSKVLFKPFYKADITKALIVANISFDIKMGTNELYIDTSTLSAVNAVIKSVELPDLTPVQFHYMLNKSGLSDAIALLLPALKGEDNERWSIYKAYLEQARSYEFDKAYTMLDAIKDKFLMVNENLNLTYSHLKEMWLDAKASVPS